MPATKPRRIIYLCAAAVLVSTLFYLSSTPHSTSETAFKKELTHKWSTANPALHQKPLDSVSVDQTEAGDKIDASSSSNNGDDKKFEGATDGSSSSSATTTADKSSTSFEPDPDSPFYIDPSDAGPDGFNEASYPFQNAITTLTQPTTLSSLANLAPINLNSKQSSHGPTFATYLCTRNSSIQDPYFLATEQLVYRTLWKPTSRSTKAHPFTVFVAPFISTEQRDLLSGAGANVIELPLVDWKPNVAVGARWRDLFSKLHMWGQTQFSLIAFLDSDAFPLKPLDDIFEAAKMQKCKKELLEHAEDKDNEKEICDYVFAGARMMYIEEINVGVTVFNPNPAMHKRLIRESADPSHWDNAMAEQSFLNRYFSRTGPFPMQFIPREYNGFWANDDEEDKLKVIHEKLWAFAGNALWAEGLFEKTHQEMLEFYEGAEFVKKRKSEAGKEGGKTVF